VLDKFFDAGHYMKKNMTQHCPSKAEFTAEGVATVSGSCPSANTTALKSGKTLKNREV
jgi:hypothetical protein